MRRLSVANLATERAAVEFDQDLALLLDGLEAVRASKTGDERLIARERDISGVKAPITGHWCTDTGERWRGVDMGLGDKIDNAAEKLSGKAKETAGKASDDERLESEGKADQASANVKQAGEKVKDAVKDITR